MNASPAPRPTGLHILLRGAGYAILVWVACAVSYWPIAYQSSITQVWPTTAAVLACALLRPPREWLTLAVATFATAITYFHFVNGLPWGVGSLFMLLNVVQIFATAYAIRRLRPAGLTFDSPADVTALTVAVAAVTAICTLPALVLLPHVRTVNPLTYACLRWTAHGLVALLVVPFVVAWAHIRWRPERWRLRQTIGAAVLVAAAPVMNHYAFAAEPRFAPFLPAPFLAIIPIVFAALWFGSRGVTAAMMLLALQAIGRLPQGTGWPAVPSLLDRLSVVQFYLGFVALTGLYLGAAVAQRNRALEFLGRSEERLKRIFHTPLVPMAIVRDAIVESGNAAFARLFGLNLAEDLAGRPIRQFTDALMATAAQDGSQTESSLPESPAEARGFKADGANFLLEWQTAPLQLEDGPRRLLAARDLTDRKRSEQEIIRINSVLRTVLSCNRALVRARTESDLLLGICQAICGGTGYAAAWVGMAEHDPGHTIRIAAASGTAPRYLEGLTLSWADIPQGRGPAGVALRTAATVVCADLSLDPGFAPWRDRAREYGFASSIALPLREGTDAFGVVSFYSVEPHAFSPEAASLLEEMADSVAYGILALREQERRQQAESEVRRLLDEARRVRITLLGLLEDRQAAEHALQVSEERLSIALKASKLGIWRRNVETQDVEWDRRMFEIFGFDPARGVPTLELVLARVAEADRDKARHVLAAGFIDERHASVRFELIALDGSVRHVDTEAVVHFDQRGQSRWIVGVANDVSSIVENTAVAERLKGQLQQAQKMEALGNLAAGVAHDFNNLLTGINGFVELASASLGPAHEAFDLLGQAHRGALSARDLVRRILNFSRSSKDRPRAVVNLVDVVRDTAPLVAAALPANISLAVQVQVENVPVLADHGQVQQLLMNLCTNGGHAIGTKAGTIRIELGLADLNAAAAADLAIRCSAGRYARLVVADDGCGMNEVTRNRIFEPFFTTKGVGEGTGLGLSIVRDVVVSHEGGLDLQTAVGRGTAFSIFFPTTTAQRQEAAATGAPVGYRGQGQRILLVDDEPAIAMVARLALQRYSFAPETYTSATEAWARFESNPGYFRLVMVDQNMPEITGSQFVERIRAIAPKTPVVLMSGRFEGSELPHGSEASHLTALKKPFEITELLAAVMSSLNESGAA